MSLARASVRQVLPTLLVSAVLLVGAVYWHTLDYRFYWDDYATIRAWRIDQIQTALAGLYRPLTTDAVFYRPLTSLYYALSFELFGLNTTALHAIPIVGLAIAAALVGTFLERETGSRRQALMGIAVFAMHPNVAGSMGPWIANQYQTFAAICALVGLVLWQRCRTGPARGWWPLAVPCVAAALLKEEGLLLPLVFPAVQWVRARWLHDLPRPPVAVVAAAVALSTGLFALRYAMLGGIGGYNEEITLTRLVWNLGRAGIDVLIRERGLDALGLTVTAIKIGLLAAALTIVWRRANDVAAGIVLTGLTMGAILTLPLAIVSGPGRYYFVATSAVLMVAGVVNAGVRAAQSPRARASLTLTAVVLSAALLLQTQDRIAQFAPCSAAKHDHDINEVIATDAVPAEVREWLMSPEWTCSQPMTEALPVITYGLEPAVTAEPVRRSRWRHITAMVTLQASRAVISFRVPAATAAAPTRVELRVNAGRVSTWDIATPEWHTMSIDLVPSLRTWLWTRHRVDLEADVPPEMLGAIEWRTLVPLEGS